MATIQDGRRQTADGGKIAFFAVRRLSSAVFCSSWMGSLLFHLLLFVLIFFFYRQSEIVVRGVPGEGEAVIGIVYANRGAGSGVYTGRLGPFGNNTENADAAEGGAGPAFSDAVEKPLSGATFANDVPTLPVLGHGNANGLQGLNPGAGPGNGRGGPGLGDGGGDGGREGSISLRMFSPKGTGTRFVFVIDRSESMNERGGRPMQIAKGELLRNIQLLKDNHLFNIIFYNDAVATWKPGLVNAKEVEKANAHKFVEGIVPIGGTKHFEPLSAALRMRPDVIFFLTDGDENDALRPGEMEDLLKANRYAVQVNVIQFGLDGRQSNFLRQLAKEHHGEYEYIKVANF